jgi:hypothetical protein
MNGEDSLEGFIRRECASHVPPAAMAVAEAARTRHGASVRAVLFYGSCLRDGWDEDRIIDLYLLVDSRSAALGSAVSAFFCRMLPPNVYYVETGHNGETIRAKYALLSYEQFLRGVSGGWFHPYLWARFAQPVAIVFATSDVERDRLVRALADAARTTVGETLPLLPDTFGSHQLWSRAFAETYRTELRSEGPERARQIAAAHAERYERITDLVLREKVASQDIRPADDDQRLYVNRASSRARSASRRRWLIRRIWGKTLSVLRLIKAAFTFQGGASYLAWKIERHSGIEVELTPWQERHPILASPFLFWRLYRRGAFR